MSAFRAQKGFIRTLPLAINYLETKSYSTTAHVLGRNTKKHKHQDFVRGEERRRLPLLIFHLTFRRCIRGKVSIAFPFSSLGDNNVSIPVFWKLTLILLEEQALCTSQKNGSNMYRELFVKILVQSD